jgi:hypothetical protein
MDWRGDLGLALRHAGHSAGRSYGGSKRGLGFEESVELAGHVADQAASDLAVGLALSPAPLGRGTGRRVIAQPGQPDQVQGLVEVTVAGPVEPHPDPLARGGRDRGAQPSPPWSWLPAAHHRPCHLPRSSGASVAGLRLDSVTEDRPA